MSFGADLSQRAEGIGWKEELSPCIAGIKHPGHGAHVLTCAEVAPAVTTGPPFSRTGNERVECEAIVPMTFAGNKQSDVAATLETTCHDYSRADGFNTVAKGMAVRRLTPTECERLQGFPDGFTQIPYRNKPADKCPDGPRYKALGNSMAVPVMRWIGERIHVVRAI